MAYEQANLELAQAGMTVLAVGGGFGAIPDQAGLDARLGPPHIVVDNPAHVPIDASGITEAPRDLIADGLLEIRPFKSGGLNDVYDFVSRDPQARSRFGEGAEIPAEMHHQPVDAYKGKLSYELSPETAARDERTLGAIRDRLEHDPQTEGLHLAETHILGNTSGGQRLVVQRTVHGESFVPLIRSSFEPAIGSHGLTDTGMRNLYAALFNHDLELGPLAELTDPEIARLHAAWESPDMVRIRDLTRKLRRLDADPALTLVNTPLWSLNPVNLNGDFAHKNMLFWRGPDGRLNLTLYDF